MEEKSIEILAGTQEGNWDRFLIKNELRTIEGDGRKGHSPIFKVAENKMDEPCKQASKVCYQ